MRQWAVVSSINAKELIKLFYLLLPLIFFIDLRCQATHPAVESSTRLSAEEVQTIFQCLTTHYTEHELLGAKVLCVTGPSGKRIILKADYFSRFGGNSEAVSEHCPVISVIRLSEEEALRSGGYDFILTIWVKVLTKRNRKRLLKPSKI